MKCHCLVHREMNSAASSIWAGAAVSFVIVFFWMKMEPSFTNLVYLWALTLTLRLVTVESVRWVMTRRNTMRIPEKELKAAWSQIERLRLMLKDRESVLQWIADHKCRHTKDGGVCFPCYARVGLKMPDHVTSREEEKDEEV